MKISYYSDYWRYFDPNGKEYTQAEFQKYLDEHYPKPYPSDWITHSNTETKLTSDLGWKKVKHLPSIPPLEKVVGSHLVVGQHAEPRTYIWDSDYKGHWDVANYKDLTDKYWHLAQPDIDDGPTCSWGHSSWLIGSDGTLTFSGANYDSSD